MQTASILRSLLLAEQLETTPATIEDPEAPGLSPEKHGSLIGGAMSEEVFVSSRKVLSRHRGAGAFTGLQQWFTPPEGAQLISAVFGGPEAVLDPTAGAGSLLAPYPEERRFGIEIDGDHAQNAPYTAVHGNAQSVVPMLRAAGVRFAAVAANPPFGLAWRDPVHGTKGRPNKEINSTLLAYLWSLDLLSVHGQGALICGTTRLRKEILTSPEGAGIYAVVDVQGPLFDGVDLPTSIAFFAPPDNLRAEHGGGGPRGVQPVRLSATREDLPGLSDRIKETRNVRAGYVSTFASREETTRLVSGFVAVKKEHEKRLREARSKKPATNFDLDLASNKVSISMSAYTRLALANSGNEREVQLLAHSPVSYFAQNKRSWRQLMTLEAEGLLSISPALRAAAEKVVEAAEDSATPLFPLRPQMRLGWLPELDKISCKLGDARLGFVAGETYPLSTRSKVASETQERIVENRRGVPELRRFTTERRLLEVKVGNHTFDEGNQNIRFLTDHFEFPDPGCVATRFPEKVRDRRNLLKLIQRKNGFELRRFQLDHLSRLLVKERGMLAHDPGLGKCVGSGTPVLVNGTLITAEKIWSSYAANQGRFDGEGYWSEPTEPLETTALTVDGRLTKAPVSRLYRQRVAEWGRRVILDDGSKITITNRHKLHGENGWTLDIAPGGRVAVPRRVVWHGQREDPKLVELLAWQIAEGYENPDSAALSITQKDLGRLVHLHSLLSTVAESYGLGINSPRIMEPHGRTPYLRINSHSYRIFLEREFGYDWGRKSAHKRIPDRIVSSDDQSIRSFLRAYMAAEGSVSTSQRLVEITSASRELMNQLSLMFRRFGIWLRIATKRKCATNGSRILRTYYTGIIGGTSLRRLASLVEIADAEKSRKLEEVADCLGNDNVGGVPVSDLLREAREKTGLPWLHLTPSSAYAYRPNGTASPEAALRIVTRMRAAATEGAGDRWRGARNKPAKPRTLATYATLDRIALLDVADRLERRASRDVYYAKVVSVEPVWLEGWVYDFEVTGHHSYVAGGMLAHNTLDLMVLAEAHRYLGAEPQALFVTPQDLLVQWSREAKAFFNRRLEPISTPDQARRAAVRARGGEATWWITHFECLSVVGRKKVLLPHRPLDPADDLTQRLVTYKRNKRIAAGMDPNTAGRYPLVATTRDACPQCGADTAAGWNGEVCAGTEKLPGCGYSMRSIYVKSAASHLTRAFEKGVTCVDEVAEIRGDDSLRSKAVRAIGRGPHNYGATGTPMSNFILDSFYPLAWSIGAGSAAFPYDYADKGRYERDFCVVEYLHGRKEDDEEHLKKRRKILPTITNVSQFWRLAQPSVSRCRKEQTGEPIVPKTYYPIRVPMGVNQQKAHAFWLEQFASYFAWKHPDHPLVRENLVDRFAAALGQRWRLEHAATLPAADDPSREWPEARKELGELSNWTPASLKVLEIALAHAGRGEKVLIGSDLVRTGPWLAERLGEKGVRSVHITEEKAGKVGTKNPRKRAAEIDAFAAGDAQVLCSGIGAMKLGHNLTAASCVIVHGLTDGWMQFHQFLERVHRLTSADPVSVYVVIPNGSLAEKKWQLLKDKGGTSDLAYDGELSVQPEEPVDWNQVLREMKEKGIRATGDEIPEEEVEAAWAKVASLAFLTLASTLQPAGDGPLSGQFELPLAAGSEGLFGLFDAEPSRYVQNSLF